MAIIVMKLCENCGISQGMHPHQVLCAKCDKSVSQNKKLEEISELFFVNDITKSKRIERNRRLR